jgi:hypothetical protein
MVSMLDAGHVRMIVMLPGVESCDAYLGMLSMLDMFDRLTLYARPHNHLVALHNVSTPPSTHCVLGV